MLDKARGYINDMMRPGKAGVYINDMMIPNKGENILIIS